jgi:hypothetical protein
MKKTLNKKCLNSILKKRRKPGAQTRTSIQWASFATSVNSKIIVGHATAMPFRMLLQTFVAKDTDLKHVRRSQSVVNKLFLFVRLEESLVHFLFGIGFFDKSFLHGKNFMVQFHGACMQETSRRSGFPILCSQCQERTSHFGRQ